MSLGELRALPRNSTQTQYRALQSPFSNVGCCITPPWYQRNMPHVRLSPTNLHCPCFSVGTGHSVPDSFPRHISPLQVFKKQGYKECPAKAQCINCMPVGDDFDKTRCWAVKEPIIYKVRQPGITHTNGDAFRIALQDCSHVLPSVCLSQPR